MPNVFGFTRLRCDRRKNQSLSSWQWQGRGKVTRSSFSTKTDPHIEFLPLSVTKSSGALCLLCYLDKSEFISQFILHKIVIFCKSEIAI